MSGKRGADAERAVAEWLTARGVSVLGMNVRIGRYEVDLLVREGDVVAVVEVRARGAGAWGRPLDTLTVAKRARLRAAGERLWTQRFERDPSVATMRFDFAAVDWVDGRTVVEWVRGAF